MGPEGEERQSVSKRAFCEATSAAGTSAATSASAASAAAPAWISESSTATEDERSTRGSTWALLMLT